MHNPSSTTLHRLMACAAALAPLMGCAAAAPHLKVTADIVSDDFQMGPWEEQVLYFVMVDRFADGDPGNNGDVQPGVKGAWQGGDLAGLIEKLDYLQDLGVTALWVSPLVDQVDAPVTGAGFPDWAYHGYWGDDFTAVEARLGRPEDVERLITEAHRRGIAVLLDVVINHAGYGSRWERDPAMVRACPEEAAATELTRCLFGLPDFRTEDPAVRARVLGWVLGWVARYRFDGLRLDTLKHVEPEAFVALGEEARALARGRGQARFVMLGEWWGASQGDDVSRELAAAGVAETLFDFSFHGLAEGFVSGRMRAEAALHHLGRRHERGDGPRLVHFLDTHDVPTFLSRLEPARRGRYGLAAVLLMTTAGVPLVTWGAELGRVGGEWPENRAVMPWGALEEAEGRRWWALWRALIELRRGSAALRGFDFAPLVAHTGEDGALLAYRRGAPTEALAPGEACFVVVLARGEGPQEVALALEAPEGARLAVEPAVFHGAPWALALREGRWRGVAPGDSASVWRVRRR